MSRAPSSPPRQPAMPPEHLAQLEAIDQNYWWHRVRWRIVRRCIRRFAGPGPFGCYFDVGSGGGGLAGLLSRDFAFGEIRLFDQHVVPQQKLAHPRVMQHQVDLEAFAWQGLPAPQLMTCLDVLEHLAEPATLLRGLKQLAGGQPASLVVMVPAMPVLWSAWDEVAGHHRRYSRATLQQTLEAGGWRVRSCEYFFHAAVLPLLVRQRLQRPGTPVRLEFPKLPGWLNHSLERVCWLEYCLTRGGRLPFGSSLVAVAS